MMVPVSPLANFSFDFLNLEFHPVTSWKGPQQSES
jgi:hypothetical protein